MLQPFGEMRKKNFNHKYLYKSIVLNLVYKVAKAGLLFFSYNCIKILKKLFQLFIFFP